MKRFISFLFFAVLFGGYAMAYNFSAVCESGQTLYYNITSNTVPYTVEVTRENSSSPYYTTYPTGSLTIPSSVTYSGRTYSVTSIGMMAFRGSSGLTLVTIPNSVTIIGNYAFQDCSGLTSVTIPNSVTNIESSSFYGCSGLTSVTIPNSVTSIGVSAFYNCSGLSEVTIPNSIASIGSWAFRECSGLTAVYYAGSIAQWCGITFGDSYANPLYYAHNLYINNNLVDDLVIPDAITEIKQYTFWGASCMTSVFIHNSVTNIDRSAFIACSGVETIVVESGNTTYDSRDDCNAIIETATNKLVAGCMNTIIPNSVTEIGANAFYGRTGLTSFTIPNSVTSIGGHAFRGCSGLTSVTISNSVTNIESYTFYGCSGLTSVTIPNSVTSIGSLAFKNCGGLASVTIGNSIENIDNEAFNNCNGLTDIYVNSTTPPYQQGAGSPFFTNYDATLWVPCGSMDAYMLADVWNNFSDIRERFAYELNVSSANSQLGTASITQQPDCTNSSTAIITATPAEHYHFVSWNDGNTENPRTITVESDTTFTANFAIDQFTIIVESADLDMGTVSEGGTYDYGTEIQITATANEGFRFLSWSDNSTENPHYITVTEDAMYIATFEVDNSQQPIYVTINATACGSYTWNDSTYTQSGEYQQTFTASTSVDSIVTLVLEIFPLPEPEITASSVLDACNPSSVTLSAGNYSTYTWNTGESTETISVTEPGNYYVEVVDGHGCHGYSEMLEVGYSNALTEAPRLKRVGMSNTGLNIVQWTVANTNGIAGFEIYREDNIANVYTLIQRVDRPGVRSCTDLTANPSARAYRYKICAVDECGGLSPLSEPHKTMHLTINQGIDNTWNLIWSPYEGMEFASYKIYRGNTVQNMVVIGEVPSTMNTFTDSDNTNSTGFFYKVVTVANTRSDDEDEMLLGSNIVDNGLMPEYTITAVSANPNQGTVVGGGTYPEGSLVALAAIPTDGYEFLSWNDESTDNPHYLTVTGDAVYVATFVPSTDIKDNALPEIALFPNPATDILNITSSETISEIEIVNVMGQIVKRMEVNSDTALCDVEDLKAGVYIVNISTASATLSIQKFVKE